MHLPPSGWLIHRRACRPQPPARVGSREICTAGTARPSCPSPRSRRPRLGPAEEHQPQAVRVGLKPTAYGLKARSAGRRGSVKLRPASPRRHRAARVGRGGGRHASQVRGRQLDELGEPPVGGAVRELRRVPAGEQERHQDRDGARGVPGLGDGELALKVRCELGDRAELADGLAGGALAGGLSGGQVGGGVPRR